MPRPGIVLLIVVAGCATPRGGADAPPPEQPVARPYDPATEVRVEGEVTAVRAVSGPGGSVGIHLDLHSSTARHDVHLGPRFYLDEIGLHPAVGDAMSIVGARRPGQPPVILARTVTRGEQTWTLRDEAGRPLWRRGR